MTEQQAEQKTEQKTETPPDGGKEYVELPPEAEARFKRIYGNMKQWERIAGERIETEKQLRDRIDKLEDQLGKKESDDRISELKAAEKEALEAGEYDRASQVRDEITDIKVDSKIPKETKKAEAPPEASDWLTPEREERINRWAWERSDKGELLRPWADPNHPEHKNAIRQMELCVEENPGIELDEILAETDKIMGQRVKRTAAPVLSGGSDVRPKETKVSLSEDEKLVARKMYASLSPDEAVKRYAKAKARQSA